MKWWEWQYKGPYWLWAIIVVAIWATLVSIVEELDSGPAASANAKATVTIEPVDQNSPQR